MLVALVVFLCTDAMFGTGCDARHYVALAYEQADMQRDRCVLRAIPTLRSLSEPPQGHFYSGACIDMKTFNRLKASQI